MRLVRNLRVREEIVGVFLMVSAWVWELQIEGIMGV